MLNKHDVHQSTSVTARKAVNDRKGPTSIMGPVFNGQQRITSTNGREDPNRSAAPQQSCTKFNFFFYQKKSTFIVRFIQVVRPQKRNVNWRKAH